MFVHETMDQIFQHKDHYLPYFYLSTTKRIIEICLSIQQNVNDDPGRSVWHELLYLKDFWKNEK